MARWNHDRDILQECHKGDPLLLVPGAADKFALCDQLLQANLDAAEVMGSVFFEEILVTEGEQLDKSC
jgi:hypothetical protein